MGAFLGGLIVLVVVIALGIALAPYILPVLGFLIVAAIVLGVAGVIVVVALRGLDIVITYGIVRPMHWLAARLQPPPASRPEE